MLGDNNVYMLHAGPLVLHIYGWRYGNKGSISEPYRISICMHLALRYGHSCTDSSITEGSLQDRHKAHQKIEKGEKSTANARTTDNSIIPIPLRQIMYWS
ncbi:hypothetical protein LIER_23591 [Lithospermum erythrorhizon]|uniref:Uncharacterized protein n=1 Tax=Lithospermum erythrorhizon TaxID=34254 RepID=A0AAV3QZL3_LITER